MKLSQKRMQTSSLGGAKADNFSWALKQAVKAEFGSSKAFAKALGVTEGRVSQLLNPKERLQPQTLEGILTCFSSNVHRASIHQAWLSEFDQLLAPDVFQPTQHLLIELDRLSVLSPDQAIRHLAEAKIHTQDPNEWQELSERHVHLCLRIGMTLQAIQTVDEMKSRATANRNSVHMLTALWLQGNVLRSVDNVSTKMLSEANEGAMQFASGSKPKKGEALEQWRDRRAQLERDFALHALKIHEMGRLSSGNLEIALSASIRSMEMVDCPKFRYAGLEVRARIELALGRLVNTEDTLDEIKESQYLFGTEIWEKASLTTAKLWFAQGRIEESKVLIEEVANRCFERMNLHHYRVANQLGIRLFMADR